MSSSINEIQIQKKIQNQLGVHSSLFSMNLASLYVGNEISNNNLNQSSIQYGKTQLKRVLYSINTINNKRPIIHKLNIL